MATDTTQESSCTYQIEKLSHKNYWGSLMTIEMILEQYDLLAIVDGTNICPNNEPSKWTGCVSLESDMI